MAGTRVKEISHIARRLPSSEYFLILNNFLVHSRPLCCWANVCLWHVFNLLFFIFAHLFPPKVKRAKNREHNKKSLKTLSKFNNEIWLFYIETLPVIIVLLFHCRRGGKINGFSPVTYNVFFIHPLARPPARTSGLGRKRLRSPQENPSQAASLYHRWRITPGPTCTCFSPAHNRRMEWWMNANVIKQFSVYLKLQTFTLRTPSRGSARKKLLLSLLPTNRRRDNAKKIVFLSLFQDPVASVTEENILWACLLFLCVSLGGWSF